MNKTKPRLFRLLLLLLPFSAHADLHIFSLATTATGEKVQVEQWISREKSARRIGQQVHVVDIRKRTLMLIDHERRTVTHFDLMDPRPLGEFDFIIEPTDRFEKIGVWQAEEFRVTNLNRPQVEYFVWTTREHKINVQPYYNLVERLPSGNYFLAALKQTYGFPVRIVTIIQTDSGPEKTVSTVVKLENVPAPEGTYLAPRAYKKIQ